jgi:hypothetical protein
MSDPLSRFDPPANWDDFPRDREKRERFRSLWSQTLNDLTESFGGGAPNYYNPLTTRIGDAQPARVEWTAFPKPIEDGSGSPAEADDRENQAEYCEWCVQRDSTRKITRVTFTTELVEYWRALWDVDPEQVLAVYRTWINPSVQMEDLKIGTDYNPRNRWNTGSEIRLDGGGCMHMIVQSPANTLEAALGVVVGASFGGDDNPRPSSPFRTFHADELISLSVRRLVVRLNLRVSFSNPVGVYLQEPQFNRFKLPSRAPRDVQPADFWTVVRGDRGTGRALRAVFEVPASLGFKVGDIEIDGAPIQWGSQIARTLKSGTYVTPIPRTS